MINLLIKLLGAIILFFIAIHIMLFFLTPKRVPKKIPKEMEMIIKKINKKRLNDLVFAKAVYVLISKRYTSPKRAYFRYPLRLFKNNLTTLWNTKGYLPCDKQNHLFKTMLIKSSRFSEKDFKTRYTNTIPTPHQYLQIKINNQMIDTDLWGATHNIPFGQHAGL